MSKHNEFPTKPDYEAKYKALEQAVKDAIDVIKLYQSEYKDAKGGEWGAGMYEGMQDALMEINKKTGITE